MIADRLRLLLLVPPLALAMPQAALAATLHLALCGGGSIDLRVPHRHDDRDPCQAPCHAVLGGRGRTGCRASPR